MPISTRQHHQAQNEQSTGWCFYGTRGLKFLSCQQYFTSSVYSYILDRHSVGQKVSLSWQSSFQWDCCTFIELGINFEQACCMDGCLECQHSFVFHLSYMPVLNELVLIAVGWSTRFKTVLCGGLQFVALQYAFLIYLMQWIHFIFSDFIDILTVSML